jgi:hypothetical protein
MGVPSIPHVTGKGIAGTAHPVRLGPREPTERRKGTIPLDAERIRDTLSIPHYLLSHPIHQGLPGEQLLDGADDSSLSM